MLNSVPKCGTMLLRNILTMFIPWDAIYWDFITHRRGRFHGGDPRELPGHHRFICGHMQYSTESAQALAGYQKILLIRDPRTQVLSYANFLFGTDRYEASALGRHLQDNNRTFDDAVTAVIDGWPRGGTLSIRHLWPSKRTVVHGSVDQAFRQIARKWEPEAHLVVRYEDLVAHVRDLETPEARRYFETLLKCIDLELPDDWIDRVQAGADPAISSTASENVGIVPDRRKSMTPEQERHLELRAPGLRAALGYA
jgi:hypothetical protein